MGAFRWSGSIYCKGGEKKIERLYYIGIDVHLKFCVATIKGKGRRVIRRVRFNNDIQAINEFIGTVKGSYWPAKAVCESTGNYWMLLYDTLSEAKIDVKLANPKNTKVIAQAKLKDDKVDSEVLADLLRSDMISESFVPSKRYRDLRSLVRCRLDVQRARTARSNRIHAIKAKYARMPPAGGAHCAGGAGEECAGISDTDKHIIKTHQNIIEAISKEMDALEGQIARESLDDERALRLMTIPGIGHITAVTILAEVADHKRFASAEKMTSYAGLVPSHRNSGDTKRSGGITKTGSVWLRNAMVEAATTAVRYDARLKGKYERLEPRIGAMKARVAIARTMTEIVWHMLNDGTEYRTKNEGLVKRKLQRIRRKAKGAMPDNS